MIPPWVSFYDGKTAISRAGWGGVSDVMTVVPALSLFEMFAVLAPAIARRVARAEDKRTRCGK
jgi:hypothetical protein